MEQVAKDAVAIVASLYRGDIEGYSILVSEYSDPEKQSSLCGSLAALTAGVLRVVEQAGIASGEQVLANACVAIAGDE